MYFTDCQNLNGCDNNGGGSHETKDGGRESSGGFLQALLPNGKYIHNSIFMNIRVYSIESDHLQVLSAIN